MSHVNPFSTWFRQHFGVKIHQFVGKSPNIVTNFQWFFSKHLDLNLKTDKFLPQNSLQIRWINYFNICLFYRKVESPKPLNKFDLKFIRLKFGLLPTNWWISTSKFCPNYMNKGLQYFTFSGKNQIILQNHSTDFTENLSD